MSKGYEDTVLLPNRLTLEEVEELLQKAREYGSADLIGTNKIVISFVEEDDWGPKRSTC